mmetsp:Transcript_105745/g.309306  ORF Transcript_105745/g.309306 Transcript_105745/m.309306 type:complete len:171 (-) Transcript_105745:385-897(-)
MTFCLTIPGLPKDLQVSVDDFRDVLVAVETAECQVLEGNLVGMSADGLVLEDKNEVELGGIAGRPGRACSLRIGTRENLDDGDGALLLLSACEYHMKYWRLGNGGGFYRFPEPLREEGCTVALSDMYRMCWAPAGVHGSGSDFLKVIDFGGSHLTDNPSQRSDVASEASA